MTLAYRAVILREISSLASNMPIFVVIDVSLVRRTTPVVGISAEGTRFTPLNTDVLPISVYDLFNKKGLDGATALIADEFQWAVIAFGLTMNGREGFHQGFMNFSAAFPDSQIHHKNTVANGDQVVVEYGFIGTHTVPVPPAGRPVNIPGIEVYGLQSGVAL